MRVGLCGGDAAGSALAFGTKLFHLRGRSLQVFELKCRKCNKDC